ARLGIEFTDFGDVLQDTATEMLLDEHQEHVALRRERHAAEAHGLAEALAARVRDHGAACRAGLACRVHHRFRLAVFDEYDEQFAMHVNILPGEIRTISQAPGLAEGSGCEGAGRAARVMR